MSPKDKPLVWLHGEVKSPPFSPSARLEAGYLLRCLQRGNRLEMPHSRAMPTIGPRCHELRSLIYRVDKDALVVVEVFSKKTAATPRQIISVSKSRLREYDNA